MQAKSSSGVMASILAKPSLPLTTRWDRATAGDCGFRVGQDAIILALKAGEYYIFQEDAR
jgi:hypothetical protein